MTANQLRKILAPIYDRMAPLDGCCMEWAETVSATFPDAVPVGGYVSGGAHWWLEIGDEIIDFIANFEWGEAPADPAAYDERVRGRAALLAAIEARGR